MSYSKPTDEFTLDVAAIFNCYLQTHFDCVLLTATANHTHLMIQIITWGNTIPVSYIPVQWTSNNTYRISSKMCYYMLLCAIIWIVWNNVMYNV